MTWTTFHRRGEVLRAVVSAADDRRDGVLPMDVDGVSATFPDELAVLAALQLRWHTRLAGHLEREHLRSPHDLPGAVEEGWARTADELPGVRAVLDHHRAAPLDDAMAEAMVRATVKEHALLARMAGRAGLDDEAAAPVGAEIEQAARRRRSLALTSLAGRAASHGESAALAGYRPRATVRQRLRSLVA